VYHEIVSPHVHVDVHVVVPREDRPVYTLVTSGMSQKPMADGSFAELTITLPPTWPAPDSPDFATPDASWPYTLLQELAWLPLHADEMQLKLDKGTDALYDVLDEASLTEILDVDRPSVAPAKRRGWFRRSR